MQTLDSSIHILPEDLQNQIAAGEVVERPASVLKELLENSLDAGANRIYVEIQGGGQNRILVQDNGHGLRPQELKLALNRHATSKIQEFSDITHINSFGFRGEALPSIASVSKLQMASITQESTEASQIIVEFGEIQEQHPTSLREGTKILVSDLFINTPARLKFLKTNTTEAKRCQEVVKLLALANLDTEFKLLSNGKTVLDFPGKEDLIQRISRIWPPSVTENLYHLSYSREEMSITGLISDPISTQPKTDRIYFFVNRRPVQDKILLKALKEAYKKRLLSREYPQTILFLELPSRKLDINVHPAKSEIRFQDEQAIFSLVKKGVEETLNMDSLQSESIEQSHFQTLLDPRSQTAGHWSNLQNQTSGDYTPALERQNQQTLLKEEPSGHFSQETQETNKQQSPEIHSETSSRSGLEENTGFFYLGQINSSYLILSEKGSNLLILDQHTVHERILFNKFRESGEESGSQLLALPREYQLHSSQVSQLQKKGNYLRRLGFGFELHNNQMLLIKAVPEYFEFNEARDFLDSVLSAKVEGMDDIWILMSCKRAVKAGEELSRQEALSLVEAWIHTSNRFYCPHGRPAAIRLTPREFENLFKRKK